MTELHIDQADLEVLVQAHNTGDIQTLKSVGIDPNKGYLFTGLTGVGKTFTLRAIKITSLTFLDASDLFNSYLNYYRQAQGPSTHPLGYRNEYNLTIDDFGLTEPYINSMGTQIPYLTLFVDDRYLKFHQKGLLTNFTTNLSSADIATKFGDRVLSRLCEMCNFVTIIGEDLRKK